MVAKKRKSIRKIAKRLAAPASIGIGMGTQFDQVAMDFGTKKNVEEVGSSGTDIVGGFYREEQLSELQGMKGMEAYDKMRRREATVAMLLDAIKNPIKRANWCFEIEDENDPMQLQMKQLCEWNFFKGMDEGWESFLHEVLTLIDFGFSAFEAVHKTDTVFLGNAQEPNDQTDAGEAAQYADVPATPADSTDGEMTSDKGQLVTYYQKFGFRKQTSIFRWNLERKTGKIVSIQQQVSSDTAKKTLVDIPGEFCLVFTNKKEGDNYEGISALRPMYGAYLRKDLYLRLAAIGAEKSAVGTAIGTTPAGKVSPAEQAMFEAILEAYSGNESSYILKPKGWEVEIQYGEFDPSKMTMLLNFEDEQMCKAVIANFLSLGTGGNSGSLAVGGTLSNFFLSGIQAYADIIAGVINRQAIPALCKLNFGPQNSYPELSCTGINDKAGKELADIILALKNAQALTPDSKLEDFLRDQYKLPAQDPTTARQPPAPTNTFDANGNPVDTNSAAMDGGNSNPDGKGAKKDPAPSADVKKDKSALAEKKSLHLADYVKQFDKNKVAIKEAMQSNLRVMADSLKEQLVKAYNAATPAQKPNVIKQVGVKPGQLSAYKTELRGILADVATQAIAQARKEVPKAARDVKFASIYERLNPLVRRAIESQLGLVADTQAADLEKIVLFQWSSSASSSDNVDAIIADVEKRISPVLDGTSNAGMSLEAASGDLTAHVTQNSRNEFFFSPDVLETIESFTFTNEDPVSEICQNLTGQTFSVSDPAAEQFYPPLHHLCKSRIEPNEKGSGVEITGIGIVADNTEERARLEKQITLCSHHDYKLFS